MYRKFYFKPFKIYVFLIKFTKKLQESIKNLLIEETLYELKSIIL